MGMQNEFSLMDPFLLNDSVDCRALAFRQNIINKCWLAVEESDGQEIMKALLIVTLKVPLL